MKYLSLIIAVFILTSAFAAASSTKDPPVLQRAAMLVNSSAITSDGRRLSHGDWVMTNERIVMHEAGMLITPQALHFTPPHFTFVAAADPLSLYCAGCACGCDGDTIYFLNPNGKLNDDYCNGFKDQVCGTPDGELHHIGFCMAALVPCE